MNTNEPDDEPEEIIDEQTFLRRIREDPEFAAGMKEVLEFTLALPPTPENAEMQELARLALKSQKSFDLLGAMVQKMEASLQRVRQLDADEVPEALRELSEAIDAMNDDALDLPEPHRTNLFARITELQSRWRNP